MLNEIIPAEFIQHLPEVNGTYSLKSKHCLYLIFLLSDGEYHSGEKLGKQLGLSRSAIWKRIQEVKALGLEINSFPNKGYAISQGVDFLDEMRIRSFLSVASNQLLANFSIFLTLDSTNRFLLEQVKNGASRGLVCLAEYQFAGRGRRGKQWLSPFGRNIYLSILWRFQASPHALAGLSLAVGVALLRALSSFNLLDLKIKWPNDIYSGTRKLAGVLTEIHIDAVGVCSVVIGLGINLYLSPAHKQQIDQASISLAELCSEKINRNQLTAKILEHLVAVLQTYEKTGLSSFLKEWENGDYLRGKLININTHQQETVGFAQGIDEVGGLMVNVNGVLQVFRSGEVSVKLLPAQALTV